MSLHYIQNARMDCLAVAKALFQLAQLLGERVLVKYHLVCACVLCSVQLELALFAVCVTIFNTVLSCRPIVQLSVFWILKNWHWLQR